MAKDIAWKSSSVDLGGAIVDIRRAGRGTPLVVLHHEIGPLEGQPFHDTLARQFDVIVPQHPGFGSERRPEWMRNVRDVAATYRMMLARLGIGRHVLVGLGFGGWIAAEMATMGPADLDALAIVGGMGVKPPEGDILDQALIDHIAYIRAGFHDASTFERVFGAEPPGEQLVAWDFSREMSYRLAWKPYMRSLTLAQLLRGVDTPSLVVWGDDDRIVPRSTADVFAGALRNSRLEIVPKCGHFVDMEKPAELAALITGFVGSLKAAA